jgi:hypothetical protein
MKTLIYQYYYSLPWNERSHHIMNDENKYSDYSRQSIKAYADKFGHDYKFMDHKHPVSPFYSIFNPFTEGWAEEYDAICWMDADILATTTADDVFSQFHPGKISAYFMETQNRWKDGGIFEWFKDKGHANSGVIIWPRACYRFVREFTKDLQDLHDNRTVLETSLGNFDQAQVNKILRELDAYKEMDKSWNYHLGRYPHENRWNAHLIHYWRKFKPMLLKDFENDRILK